MEFTNQTCPVRSVQCRCNECVILLRSMHRRRVSSILKRGLTGALRELRGGGKNRIFGFVLIVKNLH